MFGLTYVAYNYFYSLFFKNKKIILKYYPTIVLLSILIS